MTAALPWRGFRGFGAVGIEGLDLAIFGEKDYQQLVIVRRLVADLCIPVQVLAGATVRDHDGLALSSRNRYLSRGERNIASRLYETLKSAKQRILNGEEVWNTR